MCAADAGPPAMPARAPAPPSPFRVSAHSGDDLLRECGDVPLQFFSDDAAANEEREKIIKEFYRRVRFSSNDRSVPASDQQ